MAESKRSGSRWIVGLAGLGAVALTTWLTRDGLPEAQEGAAVPGTPAGLAAPLVPGAAPGADFDGPRIEAGGRLVLDAASLPERGALGLALDLPDAARGDGARDARIVSTDGWRIDTKASPLPGAGSGLHLEIERDLLTPARYMIEVDTEDAHPFQIRRWVLEIR